MVVVRMLCLRAGRQVQQSGNAVGENANERAAAAASVEPRREREARAIFTREEPRCASTGGDGESGSVTNLAPIRSDAGGSHLPGLVACVNQVTDAPRLSTRTVVNDRRA